MSQLVVDNLSPETLEALAERAKTHGRSPEDEAGEILTGALGKMQAAWRDGDRSAISRVSDDVAWLTGLTEERRAFVLECRRLRQEQAARGLMFDSAAIVREMRDER